MDLQPLKSSTPKCQGCHSDRKAEVPDKGCDVREKSADRGCRRQLTYAYDVKRESEPDDEENPQKAGNDTDAETWKDAETMDDITDDSVDSMASYVDAECPEDYAMGQQVRPTGDVTDLLESRATQQDCGPPSMSQVDQNTYDVLATTDKPTSTQLSPLNMKQSCDKQEQERTLEGVDSHDSGSRDSLRRPAEREDFSTACGGAGKPAPEKTDSCVSSADRTDLPSSSSTAPYSFLPTPPPRGPNDVKRSSRKWRGRSKSVIVTSKPVPELMRSHSDVSSSSGSRRLPRPPEGQGPSHNKDNGRGSLTDSSLVTPPRLRRSQSLVTSPLSPRQTRGRQRGRSQSVAISPLSPSPLPASRIPRPLEEVCPSPLPASPGPGRRGVEGMDEGGSVGDSLKLLNWELREHVARLRSQLEEQRGTARQAQWQKVVGVQAVREQEQRRAAQQQVEQRERLLAERSRDLETLRQTMQARHEGELRRFSRQREAEVTKLRQQMAAQAAMLARKSGEQGEKNGDENEAARRKWLEEVRELRKQVRHLAAKLATAEEAQRHHAEDLRASQDRYQVSLIMTRREARTTHSHLVSASPVTSLSSVAH